MRLRRLLAGAAGGLALTAAANRVLRSRSGRLDPALSGDHDWYRWRGFDVAYAEAGDPEAPDVVLLHGVHAAASSREFVDVFDELAENYHVIAPDLPGFGRSDRPPVAYTSKLYERFVADFLTDVADDPTVVASSHSGVWATMAASDDGVGTAVGTGSAASGGADVSELVLVCPTADTGPRRPWVRTLFRTPLVGTGLYNALTSKPSLRWFDEREGYYRPEHVTDDVVDYQWRTAHQPGARFAPASFVSGYLDPDIDLATTLATIDLPVTLVWGREATVTPLSEGRELADGADARLVVLDDTRLLPHAEEPDSFLEAIRPALPQLEWH